MPKKFGSLAKLKYTQGVESRKLGIFIRGSTYTVFKRNQIYPNFCKARSFFGLFLLDYLTVFIFYRKINTVFLFVRMSALTYKDVLKKIRCDFQRRVFHLFVCSNKTRHPGVGANKTIFIFLASIFYQ